MIFFLFFSSESKICLNLRQAQAGPGLGKKRRGLWTQDRPGLAIETRTTPANYAPGGAGQRKNGTVACLSWDLAGRAPGVAHNEHAGDKLQFRHKK